MSIKACRPVVLVGAVLAVLVALLPATSSHASGAPLMTRVGPRLLAPNPHYYQDTTTHEHFSSPAVADLYGDGRQEIVAGFPDGTVRIYPFDGHTIGIATSIFQTTDGGGVQASPLITDLNGDGRLDVVVANMKGAVEAFTPSLGNRVIFKVSTGYGTGHDGGNFATPVVADINRDGVRDVIETSWDQYVHVWSSKPDSAGHFNELPGFPRHLQDDSWSSPTVADVDHDGWPELIFGYDCDGAPGQWCARNYHSYGGYVTVLRHDGTTEPGWPRFIAHSVVWSSPSIVDLNGDGWQDVVIGSGNMAYTMYGHHPMDGGKAVYAYRGKDDTPVPGFPVPLSGKVTSSPAIGHILGNSDNQIAVVSEDGMLTVIGATGHVWARTCINDALARCGYIGYHTSVTIADVDNDGRQEIIVGGEQWLDIFRWVNDRLVLIARGWPGDAAHGQVTPNEFAAAPTVASVNGKCWVVMSTDAIVAGGTVGATYAFTMGTPCGRADWPYFKHDAARTSVS